MITQFRAPQNEITLRTNKIVINLFKDQHATKFKQISAVYSLLFRSFQRNKSIAYSYRWIKCRRLVFILFNACKLLIVKWIKCIFTQKRNMLPILRKGFIIEDTILTTNDASLIWWKLYNYYFKHWFQLSPVYGLFHGKVLLDSNEINNIILPASLKKG